MRRLSGRLEHLEQRQGGGLRCAVCREWKQWRVVCREPELLADGWDLDGDTQPPEHCPGCGWRPDTIVIAWEEA